MPERGNVSHRQKDLCFTDLDDLIPGLSVQGSLTRPRRRKGAGNIGEADGVREDVRQFIINWFDKANKDACNEIYSEDA